MNDKITNQTYFPGKMLTKEEINEIIANKKITEIMETIPFKELRLIPEKETGRIDYDLEEFMRQALQELSDHYENELKIADDRWKDNEKYKDLYFELKPDEQD